MKSKTRVVIYYRVSTDKQESANQVPELMREVERRDDWVLANTYVDEGVSGGKTSRPKLDLMMDELRRGKYDLLLVYSYDRFGRDEIHLLLTMDELNKRGIHFVSLKEQLDTTTNIGRMAFTFVAGVAGFVRRQIGEKTSAALQRKKAQGMKLGRPTVPQEIKSRVIDLHRQGLSLKKISLQVRWLRASGKYGPRKETTLSKSVVGNIVAEYTGKRRPQIAPPIVASGVDGEVVA